MQNARLTKARRLVTSFAVLAIALVGTMVPRSSVEQTFTLVPPDNSLQLPEECNGVKPCWLRRPAAGNLTATQAYYRNIRAITGSIQSPIRETLDDFKARNGFAPGVSGDVQAIYFNEGDLRFGRDMHCRQNGPKVACYVSNYGKTADDPNWPDTQDALAKAIAGPDGSRQPFATVAMEYSPTPAVRFITVREKDGETTNRDERSDCVGVGTISSPGGIPGVDVDTGIDIEPGDFVKFTATGRIWSGVCLTSESDANGHQNPGPMYPLPTAPGYGLIGRVGSGGDYFYIGDGNLGPESFQGKRGGRLFLRTNDDKPGDGYGAFSVKVEVDRQNVKFYVYKAKVDNNVLFDDPALDAEGSKFAPQMCMTCHGGTYNVNTNRVKGASFLPFDLSNFIFSSNPAFARSAQEEKFRQLNALVRLANPNSGSAVAEMIDWMYIQTNANIPASVNIAGTAARDTGVTTVPGWVGNTDHVTLYQSFFRPYCRSCHVAARSPFEFNSHAQFQAYAATGRLNSILCGTGEMPHAQVPYQKLKGALFDDVTATQLRGLGVTCVTKKPATTRLATPPGAELEFSTLCARFPEFPPCRR